MNVVKHAWCGVRDGVRRMLRGWCELAVDLARFPPTAILLGALLIVDVACLDPASIAGGLLAGNPRRTCCLRFTRGQAYLNADGSIVVLDAHAPLPADVDPGTEIATFSLAAPRTRRSGLWGLTSETRLYAVPQLSTEVLLTPELEEKSRRAFCAFLAQSPDDSIREAAAVLAGAGGFTPKPLLGGYIHNGIAASMAAMFCFSIGMLGADARHIRSRRSRVQAGLCPACGYDRAGNPTMTCPECGADTRVLV